MARQARHMSCNNCLKMTEWPPCRHRQGEPMLRIWNRLRKSMMHCPRTSYLHVFLRFLDCMWLQDYEMAKQLNEDLIKVSFASSMHHCVFVALNDWKLSQQIMKISPLTSPRSGSFRKLSQMETRELRPWSNWLVYCSLVVWMRSTRWFPKLLDIMMDRPLSCSGTKILCVLPRLVAPWQPCFKFSCNQAAAWWQCTNVITWALVF